MSEKVLQDKPTATVLGVELAKRPFTNAELDEWARIYDERGFEAAEKKLVTLRGEIQKLSNKRIEVQKKAVEKLEEKLNQEYDRDDWNVDRIAHLTMRIVEENEKLAALEHEDNGRVATQSFDIVDQADEANTVKLEAYLEMTHFLAGRPDTFDDWRSRAREDDYQAAQEVVEAGVTPFGRRRIRAARGGKGTR